MFLFDPIRWAVPLHNPLGLSAGDFVELLLAALLIFSAWIWRVPLTRRAQRFSERTGWCMLVLALSPVALRLALLSHHPIPLPDIYDEFSHLLVADTLRHFRLANPPHPMEAFFETFFVLQTPTYSSIYPVGQGLLLAFGKAVFGVPWAAVVLATGALCALCYWMLRGWTTAGWALVGGVLAVFEFGPLNQWMNSYWGGALPAAAGCLVFGALPRLSGKSGRRAALVLGLGVAIHLLARPFESIFLVLSVLIFLTPHWRSIRRRSALALLTALPAFALTLLQNHAVTRSWTALPYALSQYQYGVPAGLTVQAPPMPHHVLTPEQATDYRMQRNFLAGHETPATYAERLGYRLRFYRFFLLPPLYIAAFAFAFRLSEFRFAWVAITVLIFALGVNFFPAWQFHYVAAETCLFLLVSVVGLERLSRTSAEAARVVVLLCCVHFTFWYAMHFFETWDFSAVMRQYESWQGVDRNEDRRAAVAEDVALHPGRLLILVQYGPRHIFQEEWVWNEADIDRSRVVWARDLGPLENEKLIRYYPGRTVLSLDADVRPLPRLAPYVVVIPEAVVPETASPAISARPATPPSVQTLHFEPVPAAPSGAPPR